MRRLLPRSQNDSYCKSFNNEPSARTFSRARGLVWIGHLPPKQGVPGSNPGGPAISCSTISKSYDVIAKYGDNWMSDEDHPPYDFLPGLDLSEAFYEEAVKPIIDKHFPELAYSAARIGHGSDVLGYDTAQSMDHGWGPQLQIFLKDSDYSSIKEELDEVLRQNLPYEIRGFPTNFSYHEDGTTRMEMITSGPVNHGVIINTISAFFIEYLGFNPTQDLRIIDWLVLPQQMLQSIANGRVFHDALGKLEPIHNKLEYYPHDLWLYLLANQWRRISQEQAFMGRSGQVGDELGSRIIATRLIRDIMMLCFLMEKKYAPYIKWFGTAFSQLDSAKTLTPLFIQIMDAPTWQKRQVPLTKA